MNALARPLILAFAALALAASGYASYVHYQMILDPLYAPACDVSSTVQCTDVFTSAYGSMLGVPVAIGGIIWSVAVLLLAGLGMGSADRDRAAASAGYVFLLSVIGLAAVFYFAYISFFVLKTLCPACATVYVAVIGIFLLSSRAASIALTSLPGRLDKDLRAVMMRPVAAVLALLWVVGSVTLIAFFREDEGQAPQREQAAAVPTAPVETLDEGQLAEWHAWLDRQPRLTDVAAVAPVKVRLIKFNDYQCPSCRATWTLYKDVIARLSAKYPGAFKYETLDYPLEPECGFGGVHQSACEGAVAVRLAREQNRDPEMEAWLYEHQPELTRDSIKGALRTIAKVSGDEYDSRYAEIIPKVREDAQLGNKLGVTGTPTFYLNGIKMPSVRAAHLEAAVEYELRKAGP